MTVTEELLRNNEAYASSFDKGDLPLPPGKKVAVLACMDARLNPYGVLGTEEIILVHHTDCAMLTFTDDEFKRQIQDEVGIKPEWSAEAFGDLDEDVRQSIARIKASPFIPRKHSVRGFVYDVSKGRLHEVI